MAENAPNYPKISKTPAYPKGNKFPNAPDKDFHTGDVANVGNTTGKAPATSELPNGSQMPGAVSDWHQRGVDNGSDRGETPVETPPTISQRGDYVAKDLTQQKVMEKNDPTHDGKSFKNRSWEDGNFENRRLFY